jgi:hypothetical protein
MDLIRRRLGEAEPLHRGKVDMPREKAAIDHENGAAISSQTGEFLILIKSFSTYARLSGCHRRPRLMTR